VKNDLQEPAMTSMTSMIHDIPSSNDPADITELTTIDQSLLLALWQTLASQ